MAIARTFALDYSVRISERCHATCIFKCKTKIFNFVAKNGKAVFVFKNTNLVTFFGFISKISNWRVVIHFKIPVQLYSSLSALLCWSVYCFAIAAKSSRGVHPVAILGLKLCAGIITKLVHKTTFFAYNIFYISIWSIHVGK